MGSSPVDGNTAAAASTGAQSNDATLDANAAQNQQFSNQTRNSLFGTYNPTSNSYSGGSVSQFLNPSSLNQTGLTGTFKNQYNNAANQSAQTAQQGVSTAMQNAANQGMGRMPSGYEADQERQSYNQQAANNGNLYENAANQQYTDALNNYWNANNMLNSNASQTANLSLQGNQAAAGNYSSLYGTSEGQQQNPALGILNTAIAAGGNVGASAIKAPCWIAEAIWGIDDGRTHLVRAWLNGPFADSTLGAAVMALYRRYGERVASAVRRFALLKRCMRPLFESALRRAAFDVETALAYGN